MNSMYEVRGTNFKVVVIVYNRTKTFHFYYPFFFKNKTLL